MTTNTILTVGDLAPEALMLLVGELTFARLVNRQYDNRFGITGAKIGATANVKKPPLFTVGSGAAVTTQNFEQTSVPVVLDTQSNIAVEFSSADLTLSLNSFSTDVLMPAVRKLAAQIDFNGISTMYKHVYNQVGTPGTAISSVETFYDAMAKLQDNLAGTDDLLILADQRTLNKASSLIATTMWAPRTNDDIVKSYVSDALNFEWHLNSNVIRHTVGAWGAGTTLIKGAAQTGASITMDGFAPSATVLKAGDVFTIAGVNAVHPLSKQDLGVLQQFVVTSAATSDGAGNVTVAISPAIVTSGKSQNVSVGPADNAAVTVAGASGTTYGISLAMHPDAFVLATAPLSSEAAASGSVKTVSDPDTGLSITLEMWRDGRAGTDVFRLDCLYGYSPLRPELAVRIAAA